MKFKYIIANLLGLCIVLLCFGFSAFSQEKGRIVAKVTDLNGVPLKGNVHTSTRSITFSFGVLDIEYSKFPDTLIFTSRGYKDVTRIITKPGTIEVRMTPIEIVLEEVVINTGYQTVSPNEINGSVAVITSDMIATRTTGNIIDRIQGQVSGLSLLQGKQENQNGTGLIIRGLGTINGPLEPLIVLDGFIYEGNIDNIDPNTIENVTVLKDAAAASIWGARAGNGVVVITTKKGLFNQKMQISVHSDLSYKSSPDLSLQYEVGATTHIELEKFLFENGHFDQMIKNTPYNARTPIVELLLKKKNGQLTQDEYETELEFWKKQDARKNYKNEFYTTARTQNYGIQLNGGSTNNNYMLSASYENQKGNLYEKNNRMNLRFTNQFKVFEKFELSANIQLTENSFEGGRPSFNSIKYGNRTTEYMAFRDALGNPLPVDVTYNGEYTDQIGQGVLLDWKNYPAEDYLHVQRKRTRQDLYSVLGLNYNMTDWLKLSGNFQYQIQNYKNEQDYSKDSYFVRNLVNQYTQINPSTGVVTRVIPYGGILQSGIGTTNSFSWRGQYNINRRIGNHYFSSVGGTEFRSVSLSSKALPSLYGYEKDPLNYSHIDNVNRYPHFITRANVAIGQGSTELTRTNNRFISYYGNLAYSYLNRYRVTGSVRRDGSNLFGVNVNDRWKPLWSVGLGWDISNEHFYEERYIANLKLTGSYGRSGNIDLTKTALPVAVVGTNRETGFRVAYIDAINNPELKWEQLDQFSIRLEGNSINNRIRANLSFFKKFGSDLYGLAPYDYTTWGGKNTIVRNVAAMEGTGLELDLKLKYIEKSYLKWSGVWLFNWNQNKTTAYYEPSLNSELSLLLNGGTRINPVVGNPLYSIAAYKWGGLNHEGKPIGYIDGEPSINYQDISRYGGLNGDNIKYFGSAIPVYYGSLINSFEIGAFTLEFNLQYQLGYFVKKAFYNSTQAISGIIHKEYLSRWKNPGDEFTTNIPVFTYPAEIYSESFYSYAEINVIPADHIRLSHINLNYRLNTTQWKNPARIFNLFAGLDNGPLLWKKNKYGIDPNSIKGDHTKPIFSLGIKTQF